MNILKGKSNLIKAKIGDKLYPNDFNSDILKDAHYSMTKEQIEAGYITIENIGKCINQKSNNTQFACCSYKLCPGLINSICIGWSGGTNYSCHKFFKICDWDD